MKTTSKPHVRLCERVERIQAEIKDVNWPGVTNWEIGFMKGIADDGIIWGSPDQQKIVDRIEKKVFTDEPAD